MGIPVSRRLQSHLSSNILVAHCSARQGQATPLRANIAHTCVLMALLTRYKRNHAYCWARLFSSSLLQVRIMDAALGAPTSPKLAQLSAHGSQWKKTLYSKCSSWHSRVRVIYCQYTFRRELEAINTITASPKGPSLWISSSGLYSYIQAFGRVARNMSPTNLVI